MARIFLTGATGFIGSWVARALLEKGHEVHALLRSGANTERIDAILSELHPVAGSMNDPEGMRAALEKMKPDVCVHLAWYAEPGLYLEAKENLQHLQSTLDLVQIAESSGCRRFVGAGTCLEYITRPTPLAEDSPLGPNTLYSVCKLATFSIGRDFAAARGMEFAWTRFFYQYGPFEHPNRLVAAVIRALLKGERAKVSSGKQVRDFLHVSDVGSAVAAVATSSLTGPVNIGSGAAVTVREVVATAAELCGQLDRVDFGALPQRAGDPPYIVADNSRLLETGWQPKLELRSGLEDSIQWWRNSMQL